MMTVTATELKNRFGQIVDQARREPVMIQTSMAATPWSFWIMLNSHVCASLEDAYWIACAG